MKVEATQPTWLDLEGTKRKTRAMRSANRDKKEENNEQDEANPGGTPSIVVVLGEHSPGHDGQSSEASNQVWGDLTPGSS